MNLSIYNFALICGMLLTLAAFPVFAQNEESEVNTKSLSDFRVWLKEENLRNPIDFSKAFSVEFEGVLDQSGKIDFSKSDFVKTSGDTRLVEIVKKYISAANDFRYFKSFRDLGAATVNIKTWQNEQDFSVEVFADTDTENKTRSVVSMLSMVVKMAVEQREDSPEKKILENTSVKADGKKFIINVIIPKNDFALLIKSELDRIK